MRLHYCRFLKPEVWTYAYALQRENTTRKMRELSCADVAKISDANINRRVFKRDVPSHHWIASCIQAMQFLIGSNFQTYVEIDYVVVPRIYRRNIC